MTEGLQRDAQHRYRWADGAWVPGVTSVVRALDKSGPLVGWAKRETAASAIRNLDQLERMVKEGGPDSAQRWLSSIPDYQRDTSADLGSRIHSIAEAIARDVPVDVSDEEAPYVMQYREWLRESHAVFVNVEFQVYSHEYQYGGTADAVVRLPAGSDGRSDTWLIDYKTGKNVYPETALQLVAYARADWAGLPGDPRKYNIPKVNRYGVLHIRPEGARLVEFSVGDQEWQAFRALRQLRGWLDTRAESVMGMREAA